MTMPAFLLLLYCFPVLLVSVLKVLWWFVVFVVLVRDKGDVFRTTNRCGGRVLLSSQTFLVLLNGFSSGL